MTGRFNSPATAGGMAASWRVLWRRVWPGVSLAIAVLIAAAPGGQGAFPVAALVPVMVIYYWVVTGAGGLPFVLVFAAGIVLDAVSYGPFGGWALVYVAVALLAATVAEFAHVSLVHRCAMLVACLSLASLLHVGLMLVFGTELPPVREVALAVGLAGAGYWVLAGLLAVATGGPGEPHLFDRAGRS
jgi:rod shape-determining protein MreD